ncbi:hypothetical protein [Candidatus Pantoea persica]|uniref:hypothetical protein n=1 Tax=Candidatus Pantoea persica TaxID=2518128 RepID=UPI00215D7FFF|nr:hypothetical protein [Candidatus Pantoea persica]
MNDIMVKAIYNNGSGGCGGRAGGWEEKLAPVTIFSGANSILQIALKGREKAASPMMCDCIMGNVPLSSWEIKSGCCSRHG